MSIWARIETLSWFPHFEAKPQSVYANTLKICRLAFYQKV